MVKTLKQKVITLEELKETPEKRNRMFTVSYKQNYNIFRIEKTFQQKKYVYELLDDPKITRYNIIMGDVINE